MWFAEEDMVVIYSTNALTPEVEDIAVRVTRMLFDSTYVPPKIKLDMLSNIMRVAFGHKGNSDQLTLILEKNLAK